MGQPADPGPSSDILRFDMVFGGGMPPAEDWEYAYADGYAAALNARRRSDEALADDFTDRKEAEADSVAEALAQAPSPPRKKKRRKPVGGGVGHRRNRPNAASTDLE
jgi:hypothetical protein